MVLPFPTFPVICAFLLFLFMVTKLVIKTKVTKNSTPKLPPGPWKLPFIGNIHHLLGSPPHQSLADLAKKYGPLMQLQLGEVSFVVVSSAEVAKEVMKTHDTNFAQRPHFLGPSIITYDCIDITFSPYGTYWSQLRKICTMELLSPKRVQSFRSIREEEVSDLIKTISLTGNSPINLTEQIFLLTFSIISRAVVGKKFRDKQQFVSTIEQFLGLSSGFTIADMHPSIKVLELMNGLRPKLEKLHQQVDRMIENIIQAHRTEAIASQLSSGEGEEDLMYVLLKIQEQGSLDFPLSDTILKAVILDMLTAGSHTSSSSVEWAFSELLKNPNLMEEAQAEVRRVFDRKGTVDETGIHELKFLKSVIKETLRLHPPLCLNPRESITSCEINGYIIPAKTKILINIWAIGRDPKYWIQAESFNPKRFLDSSIDCRGLDFEYIPFGSGRRICPGISFALANIELVLAQLLYHFDWELASGLKPEQLDMTEANGLTISKKENLHLIPIPYHPSFVE
ncbi:hypothetical protein P3X46_006538 [Hevea brasiliensis]|uniref:Cytochrome P450 n=1 Tax=Hevea brasiliensis TaxID=3981 RepID=A0ABQ9MQI9_HEVBR|nr:cytochrome P450 71D10-like [Hevea brasiliensis]KAJ9182554.1 hypothetical protein P3X46_006538 [Hevea brasiliensis]